MRAYIYIVDACDDPDDATSDPVPYAITNNVIFFGACKRYLRDELRKEFLLTGKQPTEPILIVGLNGTTNPRKILWAGLVMRVMTFAEAWEFFSGPLGDEIKRDLMSPFHIKPIYEDQKLMGYEKNGVFHIENGYWLGDIFSADPRSKGHIAETHPHYPDRVIRVTVPEGKDAASFFDRDCCLILSTVHYAKPGVGGLEIDSALQEILVDAQPEAQGITSDAPFGVTSAGKPNGKAGRSLRLNEPHSSQLYEWFQKKDAR